MKTYSAANTKSNNREDLHLNMDELMAGASHIKESPLDNGTLEMVVIRPRENERVVLSECEISYKLGINGDNWADGCWKTLNDGSPHPGVQISIINSRCINLLAQNRERWSLAGDNLYVDLNLSKETLRTGQRLSIGTAVLEITEHPHNGCKKFSQRYGVDAVNFVHSPIGKELRLRGIYAKVVQDGKISVADTVRKI